METAIAKPYTLSEVGALADQFVAQNVFALELAKMSVNTRKARQEDLATWATFLSAIGVEATGRDYLHDPTCWAGVTGGLLETYKQWMLKQGFSINAINRKVSSVRIFCTWAVRANVVTPDEIIRIQAVRTIQHGHGVELDKGRAVTRIGVKKAKAVNLSGDQVRALKSLAGETPQGRRDVLLVHLMVDQALRASEVVLLRMEDFHLKARTMTFYRPKTKETEMHRLTPGTLVALQEYLDGEGSPAAGLLMRGSNKAGRLMGDGITERSVTRRVAELGERLGIAQLSAHDLRHAAATRAARGGTDVRSLMGLGGWRSAATALRYVEASTIKNEGVKFED